MAVRKAPHPERAQSAQSKGAGCKPQSTFRFLHKLSAGEGLSFFSLTPRRGESDCLACQVASANFRRTSRALALRRTSNLRARAMRMTILDFPALLKRSWKVGKWG